MGGTGGETTMMVWKRAALGLLTVLSLARAVDYDAAGQRWWSHIVYLADDKLEGRNTGSKGYLQAARYVAGEFERAGLKPAGVDGYLQPVDFSVSKIDEAHSSLELIRDGVAEPLTLGTDAYFGL